MKEKHLPLYMILITALVTSCLSLVPEGRFMKIPDLDMKEYVYMSQGPTDLEIHHRPVGQFSVGVIYVDFPDKRDTRDTREVENMVMGGGKVQRFFKEQSYGKLDLSVHSIHGWKTMPRDQKTYDAGTTKTHREFVEHACNLFPEVDLTQYNYVLVVTPPGSGATAFSEKPKISCQTPHGIVHLAVTLGIHLSPTSWYTTCHEFGHLMGLPDVYTYGGKRAFEFSGPRHPLGDWGIMANPGAATGFIGWHRHKLTWLDDDRKAYLSQGQKEVWLTPLTNDEGVSMLVVPYKGSVSKPSDVVVIELAQPYRVSRDSEERAGEGVLIYHVDANKTSGHNSVKVYPRDGQYNLSLRKAPLLVGDVFEHENKKIDVRVLEKNGDSYKVRLTVR